jgi:Fe-S cluster biogenesis protein NfuA
MSTIDKQDWLERIHGALDEVRPHLAVDGGDVQVVDITPEFEVQVKWTGNCEFCEMSAMTLRAGIEQTLKNKFPQIQSVTAVNGHLA